MRRPPLTCTLFPYTTLFRSRVLDQIERLLALRVLLPGLLHRGRVGDRFADRSEEHTSELQSLRHLVCRLLLEKKNDDENEKVRSPHAPTCVQHLVQTGDDAC